MGDRTADADYLMWAGPSRAPTAKDWGRSGRRLTRGKSTEPLETLGDTGMFSRPSFRESRNHRGWLTTGLLALFSLSSSTQPAEGTDVEFTFDLNHRIGSIAGLTTAHPVHFGPDEHVDLLVAGGFEIVWFENDGGVNGSLPRFIRHKVIFSDDIKSYAAFPADLDLDGDTDVLVRFGRYDNDENLLHTELAWLENDGAAVPTFTERLIDTVAESGIFPRFARIHVADINGDGFPDPLMSSLEFGQVMWYEHDGTEAPTFIRHVVSTDAMGVDRLYADDVNRDNHTDILWASRTSNLVAWYENDGGSSPSFTLRTIATLTGEDGVRSLFTSDVNGDGFRDILINNHWFEHDSNTPPDFVWHSLEPDPNCGSGTDLISRHFTIEDVADIDADGNSDILGVMVYRSRRSPIGIDSMKPEILINDLPTTPGFTEQLCFGRSRATVSPLFGVDIDGDGDLDVVHTQASVDLDWSESLLLDFTNTHPIWLRLTE